MARSANNLNAVFTDTANAIREKTGSNESIAPRDFADEIAGITGGGGGVTPTGTYVLKKYSVSGDTNSVFQADISQYAKLAVNFPVWGTNGLILDITSWIDLGLSDAEVSEMYSYDTFYRYGDYSINNQARGVSFQHHAITGVIIPSFGKRTQSNPPYKWDAIRQTTERRELFGNYIYQGLITRLNYGPRIFIISTSDINEYDTTGSSLEPIDYVSLTNLLQLTSPMYGDSFACSCLFGNQGYPFETPNNAVIIFMGTRETWNYVFASVQEYQTYLGMSLIDGNLNVSINFVILCLDGIIPYDALPYDDSGSGGSGS